ELILFRFDLAIDALEGAGTIVLVHMGDDILREIEHAIEIATADIKQQAEVARHAARVPDMRNRCRQFDVAHALTAYDRAGHFDAAFIADHAFVTDILELAAVTLPVARRPKDGLAEKAVLLGTQTAVVDC